MINEVSPTSFNDLIPILYLSHGTSVWLNNAQILIKNGKSVSEVIAYRDDVFDYIQHTKLWKIHVELFMPGVVFLMK